MYSNTSAAITRKLAEFPSASMLYSMWCRMSSIRSSAPSSKRWCKHSVHPQWRVSSCSGKYVSRPSRGWAQSSAARGSSARIPMVLRCRIDDMLSSVYPSLQLEASLENPLDEPDPQPLYPCDREHPRTPSCLKPYPAETVGTPSEQSERVAQEALQRPPSRKESAQLRAQPRPRLRRVLESRTVLPMERRHP